MSSQILIALCRLTETFDKYRVGANYVLKLAILGCLTAVLLRAIAALT